MPSLLPGYEYDIFISYRQKDNKHDGWVTRFVENLKGELEATFKEDISIYFDENPHDRLQDTHNVDKSLAGKLKCLIFIPVLSQTYCDPNSYAWQYEFLAFNKFADEDRFGKNIRLRNGNYAGRILPIRIHDLEPEDVKLFEKESGSVLRAMDFVFKTSSGVNRPLKVNEDHPNDNLNKTFYGDQINKTVNAIKEIVLGLRAAPDLNDKRKTMEPPEEVDTGDNNSGKISRRTIDKNSKQFQIIFLLLFLCALGAVIIYRIFNYSNDTQLPSHFDKSIAVLPFVNDSPDTNNVYFCNGMMEDILNNLVKIKDLDVKSRTDVEALRGVKKSRKEIARELGVTFLLEGSIRKQGNQFRMMIQLIDAETGFHKWSQPYDGEMSDVFTVQADIARKVAAGLEAVITSEEEKNIEKIPTSDIRAYEFFIMAREESLKYWNTHDLRDLRTTQAYLDKAIELDPYFEEAISYKGTCYAASYQYDSAWVSAKRLIAINPESFNAYKLLGDYYRYSNDPIPAIENYKNALRYSGNRKQVDIEVINLWIGSLYCLNLNNYREGLTYIPKSVDSTNFAYWMYLGAIFGGIGEFERAEKYCKISVEFDSSSIATFGYSLILSMQSKYDEALKILDKYCKPNGVEVFCLRSRMYNHIFKKDYDKALIDVRAIYNFKNQLITNDSVFIAYLYKNTGREKEASEIIQKSLNSYKKISVTDKGSNPYLFSSFLYALMDDKKTSLEQLSKAVDLGIIWGFYKLPSIVPFYENIRNDTEFKAIINRIEDQKASQRAQVKEMELRGEIDL